MQRHFFWRDQSQMRTRLKTEAGGQRIKTSNLQFHVIEQFLRSRECDAVQIINPSQSRVSVDQ